MLRVLAMILVCFCLIGSAWACNDSGASSSSGAAAPQEVCQRDEVGDGDEGENVNLLAAGMAALRVVNGAEVLAEELLPQVEEDLCPICHQEYDGQRHGRVMLPCAVLSDQAQDHAFGFSCLHAWLIERDNAACPSCMTVIPQALKDVLAAGGVTVKLWTLLAQLKRCTAAGLQDEAAVYRDELSAYLGRFDNMPVDAWLELPAPLRQRTAMVQMLLESFRHDGSYVNDGLLVCVQALEKAVASAQEPLVQPLVQRSMEFLVTCAAPPRVEQATFIDRFEQIVSLLGQYLRTAREPERLQALSSIAVLLAGVNRVTKDFLRCPWENLRGCIELLLELLRGPAVAQEVKADAFMLANYLAFFRGIEFEPTRFKRLVDCAIIAAKTNGNACRAALAFLNTVVAQRNCFFSQQYLEQFIRVIIAQQGEEEHLVAQYLFQNLVDRNYLKGNPILVRDVLAMMSGRHIFCAARRVSPGAYAMLQSLADKGLLAAVDCVPDVGTVVAGLLADDAAAPRDEALGGILLSCDPSAGGLRRVVEGLLEQARAEYLPPRERAGALLALAAVLRKAQNESRRLDEECKEVLVDQLIVIANYGCDEEVLPGNGRAVLVAACFAVFGVVLHYTPQQVEGILQECLLPNLGGVLRAMRIAQPHAAVFLGRFLDWLAWRGRLGASGRPDGSHIAIACCEKIESIHDEADLALLINGLADFLRGRSRFLCGKVYAVLFSRHAYRAMREAIVEKFSEGQHSDALGAAVRKFEMVLSQRGSCGCCVQ